MLREGRFQICPFPTTEKSDFAESSLPLCCMVTVDHLELERAFIHGVLFVLLKGTCEQRCGNLLTLNVLILLGKTLNRSITVPLNCGCINKSFVCNCSFVQVPTSHIKSNSNCCLKEIIFISPL